MDSIEYIEFYVTDTNQSATFFINVFGFVPIATFQNEQKISIILRHGTIYFKLTMPLLDSSIQQFLEIHGEGIQNIAFSTKDVIGQYENAILHGAQSILEPTSYQQDGVTIIQAQVKAFGDIIHTLIQRDNKRDSKGNFILPMFTKLGTLNNELALFDHIDHLAICVPQGQLSHVVSYYEKIWGFEIFQQEYINASHNGMNSIVMSSPNQNIKFVLIEPTISQYSSHIDQFLLNFGGAGVQHIALRTSDILRATRELKSNGLDFLSLSGEFYEHLVHPGVYDTKDLAKYSILVESDQDGALYQTFSKSIYSNQTLFFEVIERCNFNGFGSRNINNLFNMAEQAIHTIPFNQNNDI